MTRALSILKLNLGCGKDLRRGYVNVDFTAGDVQWDLRKVPWPWLDNSADEILMWHVLEHLPDTTDAMTEVRRILKPGGVFWGQCPYGPSHDGRTCWQHHRFFVARSFESMAVDFGMRVVRAENGVHSVNWRHKLRNLVPCRELLALAGWSEAFDKVDFKLVKL